MLVMTIALGGALAAAPGQTAEPANPAAAPPAAATKAQPRRLELATASKPWIGDFDKMLERRLVRVLVPYSRTLYYSDKGRERGTTAELVREFERALNQRYKKEIGRRPVTVLIVPTTRDKLLTDVVAGRGDIAAGNITVTEERLRVVDFVAPPDVRTVDEIVVTGPKAPAIATVDDLSGKTVHVRPTTSYHQSVVELNARFQKAGKAPVTIVPLPDPLEDEDKLEMVNAGVLDIVIVDDWLARTWAPVLPRIKLVPGAAVRVGGRTGWAIRKDSPKLQAAIADIYDNVWKKQGVIPYLFAQAQKRVKQIKDNTAGEDAKRFDEMLAFFRKYGDQYHFDPLMLAAQGFQESQLNQNAKSHVGAIGVMQVMPTTGAELKVGDIRITEANIHAGAKYLDQLMTRSFPDAHFADEDRPLFAFAAYNAGPGNIARMRKLAVERGLDGEKWFNNVELVTAEKIGIETTTYVRNIYKYYVAYKLMVEHAELQRKLREQIRKKS